MEEKQPENGALEGFEGFAKTALRTQRRGIFEQLRAGLLLKANMTNDRTVKIMALCEAAYLTKDKSKLDMKIVELAQAVSISLNNTEIPVLTEDREKPVRVPWAFPENKETYKRYIEPWNKITLHYLPLRTQYRLTHYPFHGRYSTIQSHAEQLEKQNKFLDQQDHLRKKISAGINALPKHEKFFQKTTALSRDSFQAMKAEFENWALVNLSPAETAIAEQVSPEAFEQIRDLFKKPEGERQNEGPLDPIQ